MIIEEIKFIVVITMKVTYTQFINMGGLDLQREPSELIYTFIGSRREVHIALIMEIIQVVYVKAGGITYM